MRSLKKKYKESTAISKMVDLLWPDNNFFWSDLILLSIIFAHILSSYIYPIGIVQK